MSIDDRALSEPQAQDALVRRLLGVVSTMLGELRPGAPLRPPGLDDSIERDLGFDSLSRAELVLRIERDFAIRLPEGLAAKARTLRDLLDAVLRGGPLATTAAWPPAPALPPEPIVGTPERAATMVEAFRWHVERHPDREHIALIEGDEVSESISYGGLWAEAASIATGLAARGIGAGDAVAIMMPTGSGFFRAFLGAMRLGAVPVPMYPPLRWSEIEEHVRGRAAILANSLARVLVTVPEAMLVGRIARAELPGLQHVVSVDELRGSGGNASAAVATSLREAASGPGTAMLQYTSGSTGDPKGVILSHDNLLANIRAMGAAAAVTSGDRFVSWLPLYHDMGLIGAWLGTMYHGVPLVLMSPADFLARPSRWLWAIQRHRGTISAGPNFAYEIVASKVPDEDLQGLELGSWRLAFNGAEPVRATTLERFAARLARHGFDRRAMTPVYGLAESAVGLAFPPLARGPLVERIDSQVLANQGVAIPLTGTGRAALDVVSCGRPLPGHEIRAVDDSGRELPARAEGRIEFRGPSATAGYHRNADATAKLFRGAWLDTGDVGYIAGGEIFLTSRAKDLIKRGGHNIHPYDLEAAVGDIPGIRKGCVAVFGTMDPGSGTERVVVVAESSQTDPAVREALRNRIMALAGVHLDGPADDVRLVPARTILKTSSGKIRRTACRDLYERGLLEAGRPAVWRQIATLFGQALVARLHRGAQGLGRAAWGIGAWLVFASMATLGVLALPLLPTPQARRRLARVVARSIVKGLRVPLAVVGSEHLRAGAPAVLIANHASYVDAIVLVAALPSDVHFVAKREFDRTPVMGSALRRLDARFVDRVDPARGVEDTRELVAAAQRGETLLFFPEGTFSRAPGLGAFRIGGFVVAAEAGVPVTPVVIRGTRSVLRDERWLPVRGPVEVGIHPPIQPDGNDWSAAVRLRDRTREIMLLACGEPDLAR